MSKRTRQDTRALDAYRLDTLKFAVLARELFAAAETNSVGHIYLPELVALLQHIAWESNWQTSPAQIGAMAHQAVQDYGVEMGDSLTVQDFGTLLCVEPWAGLLPLWKGRELAHTVATVQCAASREKSCQTNLADFTDLIYECFREADKDGDGKLNAPELQEMLKAVGRVLGWTVTPMQLLKEVTHLSGSIRGALTLAQFGVIMCSGPFSRLLPLQVQMKLDMGSVSGVVGSSSAEVELSRAVLDLFDLVKNGFTNLRKLEALLLTLVDSSQAPAPESVSTALQQWTSDSKRIKFSEFVTILCSAPWSGLLPQRLQDELCLCSEVVEQLTIASRGIVKEARGTNIMPSRSLKNQDGRSTIAKALGSSTMKVDVNTPPWAVITRNSRNNRFGRDSCKAEVVVLHQSVCTSRVMLEYYSKKKDITQR